MADINMFISLGAGFLSFISPCCLPLYPAYLSYLTGMSIGEIERRSIFKNASFLHAIIFLLGFSTIFMVLAYSTSFIGIFFRNFQDEIRYIGSIVIIFFGLVIVGGIKSKWLMTEFRYSFKQRPSGYFGSYIIGLSFAAGWTPCNGPILGAVLSLAAIHPEESFLYLGAYILGFAIPFLLLSFFVSSMVPIKKYSIKWMKIGGYFMISMGIILLVDGMKWLTRIISPIFGDFQGF